MDSSSQNRNVNISLSVGDNQGSDNNLRILGALISIGHAPAAEMSNTLKATGLSEDELQNKPVVFMQFESPEAAQAAANVLKDLPKKLPQSLPISKLMQKANPDFKIQSNHLKIVCTESIFETDLIEAMIEEIPEQALNAENTIQLQVETAQGGTVGDIINNTLTNGGKISFKASIHKDLPGSVVSFIAQNFTGGSLQTGNKINQAMTLFDKMQINLGMKTLSEGVKNDLGPASPIIDALQHVGNLGQFVPPEVAEYKELKGIKGPIEIFYTGAGVISVKIVANLPGLGDVLFK